jgi:hypothetical protein
MKPRAAVWTGQASRGKPTDCPARPGGAPQSLAHRVKFQVEEVRPWGLLGPTQRPIKREVTLRVNTVTVLRYFPPRFQSRFFKNHSLEKNRPAGLEVRAGKRDWKTSQILQVQACRDGNPAQPSDPQVQVTRPDWPGCHGPSTGRAVTGCTVTELQVNRLFPLEPDSIGLSSKFKFSHPSSESPRGIVSRLGRTR